MSKWTSGICLVGGTVIALSLGAGCAGGENGGDDDHDGAISCGYYTERSGYTLVNLETVNFESDLAWLDGLSISRHLRRPAPDQRFDWIPLSLATLLNPGGSSVGGLGRTSFDPRCQETLQMFDDVELLEDDPEGWTAIERHAELRFRPAGFAFPATRAAADAAPDTQDVAVQTLVELTQDKTRFERGIQISENLSWQIFTFDSSCDAKAQVTKRWAPKIERDDPAFCRPGDTGMECVQFNLTFRPEHCTLSADAVTLKLPSSTTAVDLAGELTREDSVHYKLRIDDIRVGVTPRS